MDSFHGYINLSVYFILVGLWWFLNILKRYFESIYCTNPYTNRLSFPSNIKKRQLPIEQTLKIAFPFIGLLASCSSAKWTFVKNGNYTSLDQLQATSVFSLFVVHGFVDLLTTSEWVAYPDGIDYLTLVLAFLWLGLGSLHHAYTPTGSVETLQAVVQLLPAPVLIGAAFCLLVENVYRNGILPAVGRTFLIILTGSWFMHVAFVLYKPNGFPGTDVNPVYNRSDPANVRFAVAAFGLHAALVSIVMLIVYTALFVCFRRKFSKPVSSILKDEVTEGRLLMMTDSYLEQGDGDDDEDL